MSSQPEKLDRLIDEVLQDLTAGAPREGLRGRVLARIAASPEPVPIRVFEVFGWRVRPFQLAAVGTIAAVGLVAALVIPLVLRQAGPQPAETSAASRQPAVSQPAAVSAPPATAAQQVQAANAPAQLPSHRTSVQRVATASPWGAAEEEASPIASVKVDPLPDPKPIVNRAIEITPVEIQPLVIPEIQVPSLDVGGTAKSSESQK